MLSEATAKHITAELSKPLTVFSPSYFTYKPPNNMEGIPFSLLIALSKFLTIPEVTRLRACSKALYQDISEGFKIILTNYLDLPITLNISDGQLRTAYLEIKQRQLLNFQALFTDGGVSEIDHMNVVSSMWSYNGLNFCTFYQEGPSTPLTPVNCVSYFAGGYQADTFYSTLHHDEYAWRVNRLNIPDRYKLPIKHKRVYLSIDPLYNRDREFDAVLNFPRRPEVPARQQSKQILHFECTPPQEVAIVNEVAFARPAFYTGPVKTLCVFFSSWLAECSVPMSIPFGLELFETAQQAASVIRCSAVGPVSFIEYSPAQGAEFSPVLWLQFKDFSVNNFAYVLHKPRLCSRVLVHLIDADDRRRDYNLTSMQPNFDLTYCVMLGAAVPVLA
jgi:hypothetical protein